MTCFSDDDLRDNDSDHFLSRFSSSEAAKDQSIVAQSSADDGTGRNDAVPTEGLKSTNSVSAGVVGSDIGIDDFSVKMTGDIFEGVVCDVEGIVEVGKLPKEVWPLRCFST